MAYLLSLCSSHSSHRLGKRTFYFHFLYISLTSPHLKMGRLNNRREEIKTICLETCLVIKCFLFSFCYSHQMLIIFQVVVPNLRCQEQKKKNYPQPFPSHEEKPRAGRNHPYLLLPTWNPGTPPAASRFHGLWK